MRILLIHTRYRLPGGEDAVFDAERSLLERAGHDVSIVERSNSDIDSYHLLKRLLFLPVQSVWASDSRRSIRRAVGVNRPDVVHFHNIFPLISPASYLLCESLGIPVIQTLSNYRQVCPGANLFRNRRPCSLCLGKRVAWPAILHRCYRNSVSMTSSVVLGNFFHSALGTWRNSVDTYIALTEFSRALFVEAGIPDAKLTVKPNFVHPDPGFSQNQGHYVLFAGRISAEKGISTLLAAWSELSDIPIKIAGDGPLVPLVQDMVNAHPHHDIEWLGWRNSQDLVALMKGARFLVFPSLCYEGMPLSILESFACGRPVVGSRLGGIEEIVLHNHTGLLFEPGNAGDLAQNIKNLWQNAPLCYEMADNARREFVDKYTADRNLDILCRIYQSAITRVEI